MIKLRSLAISGATLALAAAAGAFMQQEKQTQVVSAGNVMTDATFVAKDDSSIEKAVVAKGDQINPMGQTEGQAIALTEIKLTSTLPIPKRETPPTLPQTEDSDPLRVAARIGVDRLPDTALRQPKSVDECAADLTGELRASAMVALTLTAPCLPHSRVTLHHTGMMFTILTDDRGVAKIDVPALSEKSVFLAMTEDGNGAALEIDVDTVELYDRTVVQSRGISGIGLHALEYGADYDSDGHVWSGAPRAADVASAGEGGFILRLGDPTLANANIAEVYTFPSVTARSGGDVRINVEIDVTDANCGRVIEGETIQVSRGAQPKVSELNVTMPECEAVGDILLLKNLVNDLKIASK
jgi:hypothetical protein